MTKKRSKLWKLLEEVHGVGIECHAFVLRAMYHASDSVCHGWIIKSCVHTVVDCWCHAVKSREENCVCVCVLMHLFGHSLALIRA